MVLRSAGFAAEEASRLDSPDSCRTIDRIFELDAAIVVAREAALAAADRAIAARGAVGEDSKPLRKLAHRIRNDRLKPDEGEGESEILLAISELRAALERRAALRLELELAFERERRAISQRLRELAGSPRFLEAIVWQNRTLLTTMIEPLIATPIEATDSKTRQKEATVAGYVQRYSVKNDTIGFFGPVGWARLGEGEHMIVLEHGPTLLDLRRVHFEYWCIDTVAQTLAADAELRLDLAPARMPTVRLEGTVVHYPIGRSAELAAEYVAVLAACDGVTSASELAARLAPSLALSATEIYELLEELEQQRLIRWTIEVPTAGQHPEAHLRRILERLPESASRTRALGVLTELEQGRSAIAAAGGDHTAVDGALRAFDALFSRLTQVAATRRAGEMYAARTLVYEDTRRAVRVELGRPFVERLGLGMSLLLQSARWYTYEVARAFRPVFERVYDELRARTGSVEIDFLTYLTEVLPHFAGQSDLAPTVKPVVDALHERWMKLLAIDLGARRVHRSAAELAAGVAAAFAAPHPGWTQARHHSPDIMVNARDLAAFERGEIEIVVNEIHVGTHTYVRPMFLNMHPDAASMIAARDADLGRPVIVTVEARANALRTDHFIPAPSDLDLETGDARSWRPREQVLEAAQLVIAPVAGRLACRTRDHARRFELVEIFEAYLQLASIQHFKIVPTLPYAPRVTIDSLIISRQSWTFAPEDMPFLSDQGADRLLGARAWARSHDLPRFIFIRVPQEPKPSFIDLESPVYVETLARLARNATRLSVSEMLPAIDHAWLADRDRHTYTAELRMAFVDPERWRPDPDR